MVIIKQKYNKIVFECMKNNMTNIHHIYWVWQKPYDWHQTDIKTFAIFTKFFKETDKVSIILTYTQDIPKNEEKEYMKLKIVLYQDMI